MWQNQLIKATKYLKLDTNKFITAKKNILSNKKAQIC